jgi:signal transduction histidine kinase
MPATSEEAVAVRETVSMNILIVDDEPSIREACAEVAHQSGMKAVVVATAEEAVEQRLREARRLPGPELHAVLKDDANTEAFGEVLRHELNNPLTGILGNAELLLAEVRRKNDGQLPNGGRQRLETIAALAVRLRETVRRLSQDWETRYRAAPQRAISPGIVRQRTAH